MACRAAAAAAAESLVSSGSLGKLAASCTAQLLTDAALVLSADIVPGVAEAWQRVVLCMVESWQLQQVGMRPAAALRLLHDPAMFRGQGRMVVVTGLFW